MSELRDEIEHQFRAHTPTADSAENITPEKTPPEDGVAVVIAAPSGYTEKFASEFKNLPHEWQVFLCERETENKNKINDCRAKLAAYDFLEFLFGNEPERFKRRGFNSVQEWLHGLAWLDQAMDENPAQTIAAVAAVYGVPLGDLRRALPSVSPDMMARICQLERGYHDLSSCLQEMQHSNFYGTLNAFGRQTDREGNLLHPYFEQVKREICGLLKNGTATDIEEAYQSALWLNPSVRSELIKQQINSEAKAAEQAKKAVFAIKGKAEQPERELTLRETIAKNMAKYVD